MLRRLQPGMMVWRRLLCSTVRANDEKAIVEMNKAYLADVPAPEDVLHLWEPAVVEPHKGKVASPDVEAPDALGHAVGKERYELLCKLHGIKDPYFEMVVKRAGSFDDPHWVPAFDWRRPVLCVCANTDGMYKYKHVVNRDIPTRCECGYWFKLVTPELPSFVAEDFKQQLYDHAAGKAHHHH